MTMDEPAYEKLYDDIMSGKINAKTAVMLIDADKDNFFKWYKKRYGKIKYLKLKISFPAMKATAKRL